MPQGVTRVARCPSHGIRLVAYCPACRGFTGGKSTSLKKGEAARRNAKKARKQSMQSAKVRKVTGVHDVFLVFVGKKGQVQVKSFNFVAPASKS